MRSIAIIPARSGSKGVIDKNIREIAGKPLIAYTIEAALKSDVFDEVMVSTDSEDYAEIALKYGASVPFLRTTENATDSASSWDMVKEVLRNYTKMGRTFEMFCLLQPTSPLRDETDIKNAYNIFCKNATVAVVSVCEAEHSPLWCGVLGNENEMDCFIDRNNVLQRQALQKFYRVNGAMYFVNIDEFLKDDYLYRKGTYAYVMDSSKSIDIDSEYDLKLAEVLIKGYKWI